MRPHRRFRARYSRATQGFFKSQIGRTPTAVVGDIPRRYRYDFRLARHGIRDPKLDLVGDWLRF
jgi:hypothetical protein